MLDYMNLSACFLVLNESRRECSVTCLECTSLVTLAFFITRNSSLITSNILLLKAAWTDKGVASNMRASYFIFCSPQAFQWRVARWHNSQSCRVSVRSLQFLGLSGWSLHVLHVHTGFLWYSGFLGEETKNCQIYIKNWQIKTNI